MSPVDEAFYAIGTKLKDESSKVYAVGHPCQNNGVSDLRFGTRGSGTGGGHDDLMFISPRASLSREQRRYLRRLVEREMELSENASFECVVRYKDFIEEFGDVGRAVREKTNLPCALVMDRLELEWSGLLANSTLRALDNTEIVNLAVDMLSALTYLHALDIVHGDVRPQNVLRHTGAFRFHGDWRRYRYRLFGHGLVPAVFSKWDEHPGQTYTAPEFEGRGRYRPTWESDVWMLGTMLQELHEARRGRIPEPIRGADSKFLTRETACDGAAMGVWDDLLEDLVVKLLRDKPGDRPRAEDALTELLEEKCKATGGLEAGDEKRELKEAIKTAQAEMWRANPIGKAWMWWVFRMNGRFEQLLLMWFGLYLCRICCLYF